METLNYYQIDLKNLSQATTYKFDYLLDNGFFDLIDGPEVKKGKVRASLSIVKVSTMFEMDFRMNGVVIVTCDRCLDDLEIPVDTTNRLVVMFGETYAEISDERVIVSKEEGYINIAWFLYEFLALALPMKHVHEISDCNKVMFLKLQEHSVDEMTSDDEIAHFGNIRQTIDPRWETLRHLFEDN